jgi:rSAM/selenodomain-associated transferase 2
MQHSISVIIPTYNEAAHIARLVRLLIENGQDELAEVIVVDGGSTDDTLALAAGAGAKAVLSAQKGRAAQMNYAASIATGSILYFVHADVQPHTQYIDHIEWAIEKGFDFGCYRYRFASKKTLLRFNGYMTRFNSVWAGGGDQTLFIKKDVFQQLSGFRPGYRIMEDFDLVKRAKKNKFKFIILPYSILVSARKYEKNSWLRVQWANTVIVMAWKRGASQDWMVKKYKKMLRW